MSGDSTAIERLPFPPTKPLVWFRASLALCLLVMCGCYSRAAEPDAVQSGDATEGEPPVVVRVQPAETRPLAQTLSALGRCEALPQQLALLTPAVEGQVAEILVAEGDPVLAGRPIIRLDPTLANADLAEKTAARDLLTASLKLLESLPRPEEQAPHQLAIEQAKIAVRRAEAVVDRLQPLRARNEVSEQQLFEAEQALALARVQQQTAEAQLTALILGPRVEAVAEAQARIRGAETAVASSQAHLDLHTITAPIDGVLDSLTCRPGQTLAIGTPIGSVVDSRQLLATAWVPVGRGQSVRVGQTARVHVAGPVSSGPEGDPLSREVPGRVVFVGRIVDPQTGNLPVRVQIENSEGVFVVGESVEVSIQLNEPEPTLAAPQAAINDAGEGPVLSVVRDGKAVVLHPELGTSAAGWIAVSGTDLMPGEPVIVEGGYNLPDGTPVTIDAPPSEGTP